MEYYEDPEPPLDRETRTRIRVALMGAMDRLTPILGGDAASYPATICHELRAVLDSRILKRIHAKRAESARKRAERGY